MQSHQQRGPLSMSACIEFGTDTVMVGMENFLRADVDLGARYAFVAKKRVRSLSVGMESGIPSGRLQSITSRE